MSNVQNRVDSVVDGFDEVRKRQKPTNGECLAIFTVLAADILAEAGDLADDLFAVVEPVLRTRGMNTAAMRKLFDRCDMPAPNRKPR